jgi:hypothetical protein
MCDADAHGNIYSYSIMTKDILGGTGADMIGLQQTANGGYEGEPQKIAEKVCAAYLADGDKVLLSTPDGLAVTPASSSSSRTRVAPIISATRRATP